MTFYIRRTKLDKTGKAPVFMRITVNGQRADASIKYHIPLRLWCTAKGRAVENSKEGKELNRLLDAISFNITQVRRQLESEGQEISASAVLLRYLGKDALHSIFGSPRPLPAFACDAFFDQGTHFF